MSTEAAAPAAEAPPPPQRTIARNFGVLMSSQLVTWLVGIVGTIAIPRYLGAELIGRFHLANSIWAIAAVLLTLGMDLAVTKSVSRNPNSMSSLLTASLAARAVAAVPVAATVILYALFVGYPPEVLQLLAIVGGGTLLITVGDALSAVLKGLDRMGAISIAAIVGRLVFVSGAVALLALGFSVVAVATVAALGSGISLAILATAYRRARHDLDVAPARPDRSTVAELLRESLPYFWIGLSISIYLQVDTVVISLVVDSNEVLGWYSVYDRLAGTLMFVPTVFISAAYPTLSRLYGSDAAGSDGEHNRLTEKTFRAMLLISVPIGFGLLVTARPLVELMFGEEFSNAAPVLVVGGFVTSLTYLTTVLGMFLLSMDRQRRWTRFIALGAALTIPLDLLLVPFFQSRYGNGAIGGAVTYAITETMILGAAIYLLPRGALGQASLSYVVRVLAAGAVMATVVYPFRELFIAVPVLIGALTYGVAVATLRLISPEDRRLLAASLPIDPSPIKRRIR